MLNVWTVWLPPYIPSQTMTLPTPNPLRWNIQQLAMHSSDGARPASVVLLSQTTDNNLKRHIILLHNQSMVTYTNVLCLWCWVNTADVQVQSGQIQQSYAAVIPRDDNSRYTVPWTVRRGFGVVETSDSFNTATNNPLTSISVDSTRSIPTAHTLFTLESQCAPKEIGG